MKPDHIHPNQNGLSNSWLAYVLAGLFLLTILVICNIFPREKQFSVVHLKGKESLINWSKSYHFTFYPAGQKETGALLTEKNDLLGSTDNYFRIDTQKKTASVSQLKVIHSSG